MKRLMLVLAALLAAAPQAPALAQRAANPGDSAKTDATTDAPPAVPLAIVGATLVNPDVAPVPDAVVVVRDGRIVAAGSSDDVAIPADAEHIDVSGKWLVPGYIDTDVHFSGSGSLYARPGELDLREVVPYEQEVANTRANIDDTFRRYLRSGITTVLDTGGPPWSFEVRQRAQATDLAPRVFVAGPPISTATPLSMTGTDDLHLPVVVATTPQQARELVAKQASFKPDFITIWFSLLPEQTLQQHLPVVRAAIDEAHQRHLRVAAHAMTLEAARAVMQAGADVLVHGVVDKPVDVEFTELLKQRHVPYVPTLGNVQGYYRVYFRKPGLTTEERAWGSPDAISTFADLGRIAPDLLPDQIKQFWKQEIEPSAPKAAAQNLKVLRAAGVPIATGTDAGNTGTLHGASYFRELRLMADVGLTPAQILADSTLGGARLLGREDEIGTIAPGKFADMVVLDADPLADVANFSSIDAVVKQGSYLPADSILGEGQPAQTKRNPDAFRLLGPRDQPEAVVQRQLEAFNAHDIDAFVATYSPDVEVFVLGGERLAQGHEAIRSFYGNQFEAAPALNAGLVNRIVQGNYVIDHERATGLPDGGTHDGIAIYEVHRGKIRRAWLADGSATGVPHPSGPPEQTVAVMERMLTAFNGHDNDAEVATYSHDAEFFVLGRARTAEGADHMRANEALYKTAPNLHCEVANRIVLGNLFVAHEHLTGMPGGTLDMIVIYEVRDGRIRKYWAVP